VAYTIFKTLNTFFVSGHCFTILLVTYRLIDVLASQDFLTADKYAIHLFVNRGSRIPLLKYSIHCGVLWSDKITYSHFC